MTQINPFVFRQYDIRGKVAQDFPPDVVELLGRGYGTFLRRNNARNCAISGDVRLTTPELVGAFKNGLRACGIDVIDLGKLPTPVNYYSTFKLDVDAAVQVTGSHNPPEFNGFKLTMNRGPVFAQSIQDIRALIEKENFETGAGKESSYDIRDEYAAMLKEKIQLERPIRMLLDCGNGAGALLAPEIYRDIGVELECLFCEPDGNFPNHHPDPTIEENLVDLQKGVRAGNFDIGLALDGDADRIGAVDENGEIFWADILMALFVPEVVKPGDQVIFDVKCSQALEEMILRYGGEPLMTPTGHSILKKKMKDIKGKFAGELSGHIFFADEFFGFDDALYNGLRLARLLSRTDRKLSDLLGDVPKYYSSPEVRLSCENDEEKFRIAEKAAEYFSAHYDCVTVDGIRVKLKDGWALARASHTQPDITCRFEAASPEGLKEIEELVTNKLREFGSLENASGH